MKNIFSILQRENMKYKKKKWNGLASWHSNEKVLELTRRRSHRTPLSVQKRVPVANLHDQLDTLT